MCERTVSRINRNLGMIRDHWKSPSPLEIYIAFNQCGGDVDELILSLNDPKFIESVKAEISSLRSSLASPARPDDSDDNDMSDLEDDDEDQVARRKVRPVLKQTPRQPRPGPPLPRPKEIARDEWEQWSDAHRSSYLKGMCQRNAFLYRNLPPGQRQKNGPWSDDEKRLFLARLEEMRSQGAGAQWGIFSEAIPGRVGYQCANFYRALVLSGELEDPDYVVEDGKLRYTKRRTPPRKKPQSDSQKPLSMYERKAKKNPLQGQIDFITMKEIKVPTMSPDGYILDYNTWMTLLLNPNPQDPFTRNRINKRSLVILTFKNIDEHRGQIKNLTAAFPCGENP
jgi:hypothetical protein